MTLKEYLEKCIINCKSNIDDIKNTMNRYKYINRGIYQGCELLLKRERILLDMFEINLSELC